MLNLLPKHSGIYFVKDNINSLEFKISLRSINTLLKLPKYNIADHINGEDSITPVGTLENQPTNEEKDVIIKWQQKLFSSTECKLYSELQNCTNEQQKKYHEMLKPKDGEKRSTKPKKQQRRHARPEVETANDKNNFIFTYVHVDNFISASNLDENMQAGGIKDLHLEPFEQMFVYAALGPDTELVVLRWFQQHRLLFIYPDFTFAHSQPYFIEIDSDYRHLYSYGIEDVSAKALSPTNDQEQFIYLPELATHWRTEDELGKSFSMPPRRTQRCAIIFTINTISKFEYDNAHVRYHIKLPENTILEEGLLRATSHSSTASSSSNSSLHVALTWQITVLCEEQFDPAQHLHIFFEIISIDSWERERLEGFSHYSLNLLQPCQRTVKINCIRPVETISQAIRRYFIGGRRKFDYERFVSDGDERGSGLYCRYGERMQNSGELSLSYQILIQRSCELLNPCACRTSGMTLDDIMMAYKEARRRLEAVALN